MADSVDQRLVELLGFALTLEGVPWKRAALLVEHVRVHVFDDCEAVLISEDRFDFEARRLVLGEPKGSIRADIDEATYAVLRDPEFLKRMDQAYSSWADLIIRDNNNSPGMWMCETASAAGVDVAQWRTEQLRPAGIEDVWGATAYVGDGAFLSVLIPHHCGSTRPTEDRLQFALKLPHVLAPIVLAESIRDWSAGVTGGPKDQLSDAQLRVLRLALHGLTEKEIALRIHRSHHTVNSHLRTIYRHYNVTSRAELMALAIEHQLDDQ